MRDEFFHRAGTLLGDHRAETPLHSFSAMFLSRQMDRTDKHGFSAILENGSLESALCSDIISTDPDLGPKNVLFLDGKTWFLPEKIVRAQYSSPQRNERSSGYLQAVCYVENGRGVLLPRTFYKSNSDGNWRAGIVQYPRGGFSKGDESRADNYTQTNKPCPELMIYLEGISVVYDKEQKKFLDNTTSTRDWGFLEYEFHRGEAVYEEKNGYKNVDTFNQEVLGEFDDGGAIKPLQKYRPGYFFERSVASYGGVETLKRDLESMDYPKGFIPDFKNRPMRVIEYFHSLLGVIRTETYGAELNGAPIQWNVSYDKVGRVWIDSIVEGEGENLTTYGTQKRIIQAGVLNSKPLDYAGQTAGLPEVEKGNGDIDAFGVVRFNSSYMDLSPVLDTLKPIQEFRRARRLMSRALCDDKDGQQVEWPTDVDRMRNYYRVDKSSGQAGEWKRK